MFKAMKEIYMIKLKSPLIIKHKNKYATKEKKQARIIANHFKNQFKKEKPRRSDIQ